MPACVLSPPTHYNSFPSFHWPSFWGKHLLVPERSLHVAILLPGWRATAFGLTSALHFSGRACQFCHYWVGSCNFTAQPSATPQRSSPFVFAIPVLPHPITVGWLLRCHGGHSCARQPPSVLLALLPRPVSWFAFHLRRRPQLPADYLLPLPHLRFRCSVLVWAGRWNLPTFAHYCRCGSSRVQFLQLPFCSTRCLGSYLLPLDGTCLHTTYARCGAHYRVRRYHGDLTAVLPVVTPPPPRTTPQFRTLRVSPPTPYYFRAFIPLTVTLRHGCCHCHWFRHSPFGLPAFAGGHLPAPTPTPTPVLPFAGVGLQRPTQRRYSGAADLPCCPTYPLRCIATAALRCCIPQLYSRLVWRYRYLPLTFYTGTAFIPFKPQLPRETAFGSFTFRGRRRTYPGCPNFAVV